MSDEIRKITIVIPVFNEKDTLREILEQVEEAPLSDDDTELEREIILVNDGSWDGTKKILKEIESQNKSHIKIIHHKRNQGKGAALHSGFAAATGDVIIIQDADLEYDPWEYPILLDPILAGKADVVYGSRFMGGKPHRVLFFWHSIANRALTFVSNMFTNLNLTDVETCYKLFRTDIIRKLKLKQKRFGFEPEVTAKIAKIKGIRIYEVGISYSGRTYAEGKKIGFKDAVNAMCCILRYNLLP
ncbi:MAG: glycosyltransferase family 2 protein [Planctomycetota bacterium]|nr:MAG: glycosyltransferase family 2 protein [Planctomycetota bacterium]